MISIDRAQIATFTLALIALGGIILCVLFGFDGTALALGFGSGWLVGIFQTVNHIIIDVSENAIRRRIATEPISATTQTKKY